MTRSDPRSTPRCAPNAMASSPSPTSFIPYDTADIAALDGTAVAGPVLAHLAGATAPASHVQLTVEPPLRWVAPALVRVGDPAPPRNRRLTWTDTYIARPTITLTQDGRLSPANDSPGPPPQAASYGSPPASSPT